jgi:hypothetical protein
MMSKVFSLAALAMVLAAPAHADCALITSPCRTDSHGNTYVTEQNLGFGYTTYRNGVPYSQATENLYGSVTEYTFGKGSTTYNSDPYARDFPNNGYRR